MHISKARMEKLITTRETMKVRISTWNGMRVRYAFSEKREPASDPFILLYFMLEIDSLLPNSDGPIVDRWIVIDIVSKEQSWVDGVQSGYWDHAYNSV